jgi:hypothetical protein
VARCAARHLLKVTFNTLILFAAAAALQAGTLRTGDIVACCATYSKVRSLSHHSTTHALNGSAFVWFV